MNRLYGLIVLTKKVVIILTDNEYIDKGNTFVKEMLLFTCQTYES